MGTVAEISQRLKAAREGKGLSQSALAKLAGVPQSHISKIENTGVDLRISSLVEIARALDLEVTLVPRKALPAVQSIVRSATPEDRTAVTEAQRKAFAKELVRLQKSIISALRAHPQIKEIAQLQRQVHELQRLPLLVRDPEVLREANRVVRTFKDNAQGPDQIRRVLSLFQRLRNEVVHRISPSEPVKPAYSLEEDDHG
jgi:transcriptional regulator with XRE-family HTH domain